MFVQIFAYSMFQQCYIYRAVIFGIAYFVDKRPNGFRSIAPSSVTTDCGHTRVIPTVYMAFLNQLEQFSLTHHGISEVQPVEFYLSRTIFVCFQQIDEIVIQRSVYFKLQCTNRVCDTLEVIALAMCKIVHRVYIPLVSCTVVRIFDDTVDNGISKVHIGRSHIYFCSQSHGTLFEFSGIHPSE